MKYERRIVLSFISLKRRSNNVGLASSHSDLSKGESLTPFEHVGLNQL